MSKSTYDSKATRQSAGMVSRRKRSVSLIDTVTAAEETALQAEGLTSRRHLTAFTAAAIKEMGGQQLRDLAASLGTVPVDGADMPVCDPNGKVSEVFADLMELRRAESRALGHVSRKVQSWRLTAAQDA